MHMALQKVSPICPTSFKAKALLWDMDGILFDTEKRSIDSIIDIIGRQGLSITREYIIAHMGLGPKDLLRAYQNHLGPTFDAQLYWDTYWQERNAYYDACGMPLMPGALELLKAAQGKQIPCILASSSPQKQVIKSLDRAGVYAYFSGVVGGDMFEHAKPEPDIYLTAAKLARIPVQDCLVMEDSLNGLISGRSAGTRTIMIPDAVPFSGAHMSYCDFLGDTLTDAIALL